MTIRKQHRVGMAVAGGALWVASCIQTRSVNEGGDETTQGVQSSSESSSSSGEEAPYSTGGIATTTEGVDKTSDSSAEAEGEDTSTTEMDEGESSGTTSDPPFCGNSVIENGEECDDGHVNNGPNKLCNTGCQLNVCGDEDVSPKEECDDGNLDLEDGCNDTCLFEWVVFVTDGEWQGDLAGETADTRCQTAAGMAGLPGFYAAWISAEEGPNTLGTFELPRNSAGPYLRTDGLEVAMGWAGLTSGGLEQPLLDEWGQTAQGAVWTNTTVTGSPNNKGTCQKWTSSQGVDQGGFGDPTAINDNWTEAGAQDCDGNGHLLCIRVG